MKRVALASALLAMLSVGPSLAQEEGGGGGGSVSDALSKPVPAIAQRLYIAPMAAHTWEDKNRDTDDGWGGGLAIGKVVTNDIAFELNGFYTEFKGGSSTKLYGGGVTGLIFPTRSGFFLSLGGKYGEGKKHPGVTRTMTDANGALPPGPVTTRTPSGPKDYNTILVDTGLGYLIGPFSWLNYGSIRAEALYRHDLHEEADLGDGRHDAFGDAVFNLGALIPIGAPPAPPPPPPEPVVDIVPVAAPVDSDGDGVPDDLDQCPGTPAGEPVNEVGCPLPKKECKTPEAGQPVTLEGCAAGDKIVLRGVNFDFDKASLTTNAKTILDGVSSALGSAPAVTVEIGGHTDAKGSDEYNQKLSERRAASVVQYLIGSGVDAGRMTSQGYGEAQPVADNETDEGRELNRRVELKVTGGAAEVAPAAPPAEAMPAEAAPAADAPVAETAPAEAPPTEAPAP